MASVEVLRHGSVAEIRMNRPNVHNAMGAGFPVDLGSAADDARFGLPAAKEAFLPGMATWRLPRLIGMTWAKRLCNHAYDLPFEGQLDPLSDAMEVVLSTEEHLALRRDWAARHGEV